MIEEDHAIKITILEVIRGSEAWDIIQAANTSNNLPDSGYEYLLAKLNFVYGPGGGIVYHLYQEYFKAYSSDNKEYTTPSVKGIQPVFIGQVLYPGQVIEGWIPFIVAQNDNKPVMLYTELSAQLQLY